MIDPSTIERIIDAAEITDVIQDFITLKKRGVNFIGHCPFHNEKTPSFTVSPSKGIFKCFGCGKGGNSVNFVMEHEHISWVEALKYLARKYGIEIIEKEISSEEKEKQDDRESMMVLNAFAAKYFAGCLHNHEEGLAIGMQYLVERGFRRPVIEKFQAGYSPSSWDAFTREALKNGFKAEYLEKTGLSVNRGDRLTDRFSGRIIFPVHSLSGKILAFGARTLKQDKNVAKYLNSPESDIYHKSRVLYGLFFAKRAIVENDKCYLVEGYTDVMSMHQSGIENVVASSGTALTSEQIRLIKRFTGNITVVYDGDQAGLKASLRGIDLILEEGMNVRVLTFPEGEDPDSYSRKLNSESFVRYLRENEVDFVLFKTRLLSEQAKSDPVKKAGMIVDIVRSVARIPDRITRMVYIRECAAILNVEEKILVSETDDIRRKEAEKKIRYKQDDRYDLKLTKTSGQQFRDNFSSERNIHEREIVRLLINYGSSELFAAPEDNSAGPVMVSDFILNELEVDELELSNPLYNQTISEFKKLREQNIPPGEKLFINHQDSEISRLAADLLSSSYDISKIWKRKDTFIETEEDKLKEIVPSTILSFKSLLVRQELKETEEKIKSADNEESVLLQQRYMILKHTNIQLARQLGNRIIF
jgi:DNA primase